MEKPPRPPRPIARWKLCLFALSPALLLLVGLELLLRLSGFAYNPHDLSGPLFVADGPGRLRTSPYFAGHPLHVPPTLCRQQSFTRRKEPGTMRIAMVGGSTVWALEDGAQLRDELRRRLGREVEILNLGVLGCGSERDLWSAREALGLDIDVLMYYTGHNEFVSYSNPDTYNEVPLGMHWVPAHSRLYQLSWRLRDRFWPPGKLDAGWGQAGFRAYSDEEKERVYARFAAHVRDIAAACQRAKVQLVLGSAAANLVKPPVYSQGSLDEYLKMPEDELRRRAGAGDGQASFVLGRMLLSSGKAAEAKGFLEEAHERSPRPERANRRTNAIVRRIAAETGAPLAEVKERVEAAAREGIPGPDLFWDNCHMKDRGNAILLSEFARAILQGRPASTP